MPQWSAAEHTLFNVARRSFRLRLPHSRVWPGVSRRPMIAPLLRDDDLARDPA